jgi:predicted O-methyltransferase YrrM
MNSALINLALNGAGDADQHYITLFALSLSLKAKNILELGVRNGGSTRAFLNALEYTNGNLVSVDINDNLILRENFKNQTNWSFIVSDAIHFLKNENKIYDIILIDDWHDGIHVTKELELIYNLVTPNSLILAHDTMCWNTQPNYHYYLDQDGEFGNGGPWRAIKNLDKKIWEYSTIPVNNGLTIIRKIGEERIY